MVLLVALDYRAPVHEAGIEMGEGKEDNAFRYFISKLVGNDVSPRFNSESNDSIVKKISLSF